MKKFLLTLLVQGLTIVQYVSSQTPMYVYRNDDVINVFLVEEIDSITHSFYDTLNICHSDVVTQEIWARDTVYRIPISCIDSISFITPSTIYQPGVIQIEQSLMPYIIGCDSLSILFRPDISSELLPHVGDKLVTTELSDIFPFGFAGEVIAIEANDSAIVVECTMVELSEVFDTYYSVNCAYGYDSSALAQARVRPRRIELYNKGKQFNIPPITWTKSREIEVELIGDLALQGGTSFSGTLTPSIYVISSLIINREHGTYVSCMINANLTLEENLSLYGGLQFSHDFALPIPVEMSVAPFTFLYLNVGLTIAAGAQISGSFSAQQQVSILACADVSSKGENVIEPKFRVSATPLGYGGAICVDGGASFGVFAETGLTFFDSRIDKVAVRAETGIEMTGQYVLKNSDIHNTGDETLAYQRLAQSRFAANLYSSNSLQIGLGNIKRTLRSNRLDINLHTWNMVPDFTDVEFVRRPNSTTNAKAQAMAMGDCLFPIEVGFKVKNEANQTIDTYTHSIPYTNTPFGYQYECGSLTSSSDYVLYPTVNFLGHNLTALPVANLTEKECPASIYNVEIADKQYSEAGFPYQGSLYSFKYDIALSAHLSEQTESIADWGYLYVGLTNDTTWISLAAFGNDYTDVRYSYYRNTPIDTAQWFPYAIFSEGNQKIIGSKKQKVLKFLTCFDDNHPHPVDLGLASGTLWSCANVGATQPQDYGGYYSYAETYEKNYYDLSNYTWIQYVPPYDYLDSYYLVIPNTHGASIAEIPSYDAATALMGNDWCMPSRAQMQELVDSCSWVKTEYAGVTGWIVIGSNGNSIFLPASGNKVARQYSFGENATISWYRTAEWATASDSTWGLSLNKNGTITLSNRCAKAYGFTIRAVKRTQQEQE